MTRAFNSYETPMNGSAAMPIRKPRCAICGQRNASRRLRDRQKMAHMVCAGCVPQFLKNLRGIAGEREP